MLRPCIVRLAMSVGLACRVMNFTRSPRNMRELRERFLSLTKERHPDAVQARARVNKTNATLATQNATADMIRLVEAYQALKQQLNARVHSGACIGNAQHSASAARASDDHAADESSDFDSFLHRHTRSSSTQADSQSHASSSWHAQDSSNTRMHETAGVHEAKDGWVSAAHMIRLPWQRSAHTNATPQHHASHGRSVHTPSCSENDSYSGYAYTGSCSRNGREGTAFSDGTGGVHDAKNAPLRRQLAHLVRTRRARKHRTGARSAIAPILRNLLFVRQPQQQHGGGTESDSSGQSKQAKGCHTSSAAELGVCGGQGVLYSCSLLVPMAILVCRYYTRKVTQWLHRAPRNIWHALRYIVST